MIPRRRMLALSGAALAPATGGCSSFGSGSDGGDDSACAGDGRGCGAGAAAETLAALVEEGTELRIEVAVDETLLGVDDLATTHTSTAPSVREDPGGGEIMEDVLAVARRYARTVDRGFEVGDLSGEVIGSFAEPDRFATYRVEHEWAERTLEGDWSEQGYATAVLETVEFQT